MLGKCRMAGGRGGGETESCILARALSGLSQGRIGICIIKAHPNVGA